MSAPFGPRDINLRCGRIPAKLSNGDCVWFPGFFKSLTLLEDSQYVEDEARIFLAKHEHRDRIEEAAHRRRCQLAGFARNARRMDRYLCQSPSEQSTSTSSSHRLTPMNMSLYPPNQTAAFQPQVPGGVLRGPNSVRRQLSVRICTDSNVTYVVPSRRSVEPVEEQPEATTNSSESYAFESLEDFAQQTGISITGFSRTITPRPKMALEGMLDSCSLQRKLNKLQLDRVVPNNHHVARISFDRDVHAVLGDDSEESLHTISTAVRESQFQRNPRSPGESFSMPGSQGSTMPGTPAESPTLPSFIINMLSTFSKVATSPPPQDSAKVGGGQYPWTSTVDMQLLGPCEGP